MIDQRIPSIVGACLLALPLLSGAAWAQTPFACTGEAFIVQDLNAQLTQIDQSVSPFVFVNIGPPAGIEYNNLGFRKSDGLLYAVELATAGNNGIIQVDSTGATFNLGIPAGLPTTVRFAAGDVTPDGATMYVNGQGTGTLYRVALPALTVTSVAITGATGIVFDWAVNPVDGLLYGGDQSGGQLAVLDPATGMRTDFAVGGLPADIAFGGAWFNAAGRLFLYQNAGTIYEIDLSGPTIVNTQSGPGSTRNDGAACIQNTVGAAKSMSSSAGNALPSTITIDYVFENFDAVNSLTIVSAIDDLAAVFGTHGVDWTFTSISSAPAAFANPSFNGHSVTELVNQAPTQSIAASSTVTVTVTLELLTHAGDTDMDDNFCNQVLLTGVLGGVAFGDLSTDGADPDPDGNGDPAERDLSCFPVPVGLLSFAID